MEKKTIIDQIEIRRDGTIGVRMLKLLIENDGTETLLGYHRTSFEKTTDVDLQMAMVNTQLVRLKEGRVAATEIDQIKSVTNFVRVPKTVVKPTK